MRSESWRIEWRDRKATILSDVVACESRSGFLWGVSGEERVVARGAER